MKEYLSRGTYIFPPEPEPAAHRRHDRLHGARTCRSGTRSTSAATTSRRRGRRRSRRSPTRSRRPSTCSTRCAPRARSTDDDARRRRRADQLLRERGDPLRRGDLQDAGVHRDVGPDLPGALRRRRTPSSRRFRYGVQVNSLGLTEQQPENNVPAHRARDARRHAVARTPGPEPSSCRRGTRRSGCPARGTSSGRCASSRSSPSRRTCSSTTTSSTARTVMEAKTTELADAARAELDDVLALGGAFAAIDELKRAPRRQPGRTRAPRSRRASSRWSASTASPTTAPSPLDGDEGADSVLTVDPTVEAELSADVADVARRRATPARSRGRSTSCGAAASRDGTTT